MTLLGVRDKQDRLCYLKGSGYAYKSYNSACNGRMGCTDVEVELESGECESKT